MRQYSPKPVDTKAIKLDPTLLELAEYLARNTHEVWAAGRVGEGWTWGPGRDDASRRHPGLVPYEQLAESEKRFDRDTAMETLKLIAACGYVIQPPTSRFRPEATARNFPENLASFELAQLVDFWKGLAPGQCHGNPSVYLGLADRALALGEYLLAYDVLKEGLRFHPSDVALRQRQGLAMRRGGAVTDAAATLEELADEGNRDVETLGLLAACYKDLWQQTADPAPAHAWLVKACDAYEHAYKLHGGYWTAINVATLAICLGQRERSSLHAIASRDDCLRWLDQASTGEDRYWALATLGEANLLLHEFPAAERYYVEAVKAAAGRIGNIGSTRKNALMILSHCGVSEAQQTALLLRCLSLPRVVVFAGHRIDAPGQVEPRFPLQMETAVALEIGNALAELTCGFGYASAACGADILFHEAVLARGGEANVVLPCEAERFLAESVTIGGADWENRFRKLLASPGVRVITTSQGQISEGIANEYTNHFTFGLAGIRAWQLATDLAPLAVWDGRPDDMPGGPADAVSRWKACGCRATVIDTAPLLATARPQVATDQEPNRSSPGNPAQLPASSPAKTAHESRASINANFRPRMAALVFIDVVGYTKIGESEIPLIVEHMLGPVAQLAEARDRKPLHMSTWGDAFFFVFGAVLEAGNFALDLRDMMEQTDWISLGFKSRLEIRTALHVGPVYGYTNPISRRPDFIGTHVSRAARLEPITPAGHVYASETFAAIAFADGAQEPAASPSKEARPSELKGSLGFRCEYVGQIGMAKEYGVYPVYHVRRSKPEGYPIVAT